MFRRVKKFPLSPVNRTSQRPISFLFPLSLFAQPLSHIFAPKNTKPKPHIPVAAHIERYRKIYKENLAIQTAMLSILRTYSKNDTQLQAEDLSIMQLLYDKSAKKNSEMQIIRGLLSSKGCPIDAEGNPGPKLIAATITAATPRH